MASILEPSIGRGIHRRDLLKFGGALALSACAPRVGTIGAQPRFEWTLRPPEEAGMSSAGIEGVRAAVQKLVDDGSINGAVSAIARHNKLVWYEAQGYRDPLAKVPMSRDGIFRMMSSTKPVTAVATLMMLDEGKLSLDDPVSRFIPTFKDMVVAVAPEGTKDPSQVKLVPVEREITIRHLLTHTSGITNVGFDLPGGTSGPAALVNKNNIKMMPGDTLATYIPRLGRAALNFQPGSKFEYSPLEAPDVALRIVEIVSGQPIDVFMRERLFEPTDMSDTYFNVPASKLDRIVPIWGKESGRWQAKEHLLGRPPYTYQSGGAGLHSTVHDYLNFEMMLLNKGSFNGRRILRPETVGLMTSSQVGTLFTNWLPALTKDHTFGLLVRVATGPDNANGRSIGAFGWGGAYGTESWAEPALDLAAVFFLNMQWTTPAAEKAFEDALHKAVLP